jgi:DNA-binding NarL/FixJ family response regulator
MQLESIRTLVSDPSPMGCQLLAESLTRADPNLEIIARCTSLKDILFELGEHVSEVALISANLGEGVLVGLRGLRQIHARYPHTDCILLSDAPQRELIVEAFSNCARGICFRTDPLETLPRAIRIVRAGQIWANTEQLQYILEALSATAPVPQLVRFGEEVLSHRQQQIVTLVARGLTNREIAERLFLSQHTVKNYLFRIFEKLGISTRAELILHALSGRDGNRSLEILAVAFHFTLLDIVGHL